MKKKRKHPDAVLFQRIMKVARLLAAADQRPPQKPHRPKIE